jgi:CheY-like chemotaxis protein
MSGHGKRNKRDEWRENRRTILLVEEDDETRRILKANLQTEGYHVLLALDEKTPSTGLAAAPRLRT